MLAILFCCASIAIGQDKLPDSVRAFAQRMASEREKIVSYRVGIVVEIKILESPDFVKLKSEKSAEYYFEFSRLEGHTVYASRPIHFVNGKKHPLDWNAMGQSESFKFAGSAKKLALSEKVVMDTRLFFDPLAVGLQFCEMFNGYFSYEDSLLEWSRCSPGFVKSDASGMVALNCPNDGIKIVVDSKQGFWPISYEAFHVFDVESLRRKQEDKIDQMLTQQLTKVNGIHVPKETNISCLVDGKVGKQVCKLTFDWKTLNEPIKTGKEAALAVAEVLGMKVVKIAD